MNAYVIPISLIVIGTVVISAGARLPAYSDPNWEAPFIGAQVSLEKSRELSTKWYAAKAEAETPRHRRLDLGMGFVALGIGVGLLFALRRVRSLADLAALQSPATHRSFYILASLSWLSFIPAEWFWLGYTQGRGDYPWWADSIGIPSGGVLLFGIAGLPIILLGVSLALRGATLPVPLSLAPVFGPPYAICLGLMFAAVLAVLVLVSGISTEPFLVPSALFTLYLILSGRAAAVVRARRLTSACS